MRTLVVRAGIVLAFAAAALIASDGPHATSLTVTSECTTCHADHHDQGGILTKFTTNALLCQSCHYTGNANNSLPVENADKAVPGVDGFHHAFEVAAINAAYGAQLPLNIPMSLRVMSGNLVCSTCHNQHTASKSIGGTATISAAEKRTALGIGTMVSGGAFTANNGSWYLVEIVGNGTQATATFRYSKDNAVSWYGPFGCGNGAPVALGVDGVTVTFTGGAGAFLTGERWQFYASYPFLRASLDTGDNTAGTKFCRDCHRDWTMEHGNLEDNPGGTKRMGHPVGIALNANGRAYDRAVPLDGNGGAQGGGAADANATNDLKLDGGRIQCWTCHGVHYADGNTLTEDRP